jgi:hypothetical protein
MLNNCEVSMDSSTLLRSGRNDNFNDFMVRESTLHKFFKELATLVSLADSTPQNGVPRDSDTRAFRGGLVLSSRA